LAPEIEGKRIRGWGKGQGRRGGKLHLNECEYPKGRGVIPDFGIIISKGGDLGREKANIQQIYGECSQKKEEKRDFKK